MKIGRNNLCPCGSNKKYKHCCGAVNPLPNASAIDQKAITKINKILQKEREREGRYGKTRPIIHSKFKGYDFIAVGNQFHYSKKWKTFIDFLMDYIIKTLGSEWGQKELKKTTKERHPIINWYVETCDFQEKQTICKDEVYDVIPCGSLKAYIHLAYDLYILRHHSAIQKDVIERLKHKDQFQGARYELFVASTCIKAGFEIEYEDEKDRSKTHVEFIATHQNTRQKVCVEAKSRHREGILGVPGDPKNEDDFRIRIGGLLNDALQKEHHHPLIIFIDLNVPPNIAKKIFEKTQPSSEIRKIIAKINKEYGKSDIFNLIVFTNHPYHYGGVDEPYPPINTCAIVGRNPKLTPTHPKTIIDIYDAATKYDNIPVDFPIDEK